MQNSNIVIVTVNYKTSDLACELIDTIEEERKSLPNIRMIIVDNGSDDGSCQKISDFISSRSYKWVDLVPSPDNNGYAAGNNIGLKKIIQEEMPCDYVWLLNPDTKLRPSAGLELVRFLTEKPNCIVGSRLEDEDGTPQASGFNFPRPLNEFCGHFRLGILDKMLNSSRVLQPISNQVTTYDWLAGASLMMSLAVTKEIGFMDEEYFLYFEEVDYCLAAQRKGHQRWYIPSSRVYHAVGASTGISNHRNKTKRRPKYWFDSRRRFYLKNHSKWVLILADLGSLIGYIAWFARMRITKPEKLALEPPHYLRDLIKNSIFFRGLYL